jgi:phosphoribosylaminoimidazole-succinocarboxamide synthase
MPEAEAVHVASGKVRELYELDSERLLLTASDRISVFDVVLPTEIPDKGRVLTGLSGYWFSRTKSIVPNHLLTIREDGRSMECRKLLMLPIECVVRGYLSGSGWKSYRENGEVCGIALPGGLSESDRLPEPIFTPTTKAAEGHDAPLTPEQAGALVGDERFAELERISIELYTTAAEALLEKGIIIADTKFELGLTDDGTIVLGDEVFTPDSSRFWPADEYQPGGPQPSFDKQFVRDYTESLGWDKTPPGPGLPDHVVAGTRARYVEAFEQITRMSFDDYAAEPTKILV